jgi:hypothetical protein
MQTTFAAAASKELAAIAAALWHSQGTVTPGAALCGAAAQFIAKGRRTRGDAFRLLQVLTALCVSCSTVLFRQLCALQVFISLNICQFAHSCAALHLTAKTADKFAGFIACDAPPAV